MHAHFSFVWDHQTNQWQIVSRSGHVVYESANLADVREMMSHLRSLRPRQQAAPAGFSPRRAVAAPQSAPPAPFRLPRESRFRGLLSDRMMISVGAVLLVAATLACTPTWSAYRPVPVPAPLQAPPVVVPGQPAGFSAAPRSLSSNVRAIWQTDYRDERSMVVDTVWETQERDETYTVTRPVVETSVRYEKHVVNEPVTTYETKYTDRGTWEQPPAAPPTTSTRLQWVSGGWATDSFTGLTYWRLPGLRPVKLMTAAKALPKVWKPNIVAVPVPQTVYKPRVETRQVPVRTVRYVEEKRTRKTPVRVARQVPREVVRRVPVVSCRLVYDDGTTAPHSMVAERVAAPGRSAAQAAAPRPLPAPQLLKPVPSTEAERDTAPAAPPAELPLKAPGTLLVALEQPAAR